MSLVLSASPAIYVSNLLTDKYFSGQDKHAEKAHNLVSLNKPTEVQKNRYTGISI